MNLVAGCGTSPIASTAVGLDRNLEFLRENRDSSRSEWFVAADVTALPFRARTFHTIEFLSVLEHVPTPEVAISEIGRVAAPGAHVTINTGLATFDRLLGAISRTHRRLVTDGWHRWARSYRDYVDLVGAHFEIVGRRFRYSAFTLCAVALWDPLHVTLDESGRMIGAQAERVRRWARVGAAIASPVFALIGKVRPEWVSHTVTFYCLPRAGGDQAGDARAGCTDVEDARVRSREAGSGPTITTDHFGRLVAHTLAHRFYDPAQAVRDAMQSLFVQALWDGPVSRVLEVSASVHDGAIIYPDHVSVERDLVFTENGASHQGMNGSDDTRYDAIIWPWGLATTPVAAEACRAWAVRLGPEGVLLGMAPTSLFAHALGPAGTRRGRLFELGIRRVFTPDQLAQVMEEAGFELETWSEWGPPALVAMWNHWEHFTRRPVGRRLRALARGTMGVRRLARARLPRWVWRQWILHAARRKESGVETRGALIGFRARVRTGG